MLSEWALRHTVRVNLNRSRRFAKRVVVGCGMRDAEWDADGGRGSVIVAFAVVATDVLLLGLALWATLFPY